MGSLLRLYVCVRGSSHIPYGGSPPQKILCLCSSSLLLPCFCGYESDAEHQRPRIPSAFIFLTARAPITPLSSKAVSKIAAQALQRAHVESPRYGAHVFRHSAATHMLRQGASLPSMGAVLRHASVETTAHYAKVDVTLLHTVARPWPEVTSC